MVENVDSTEQHTAAAAQRYCIFFSPVELRTGFKINFFRMEWYNLFQNLAVMQFCINFKVDPGYLEKYDLDF